MRILFLGFTKMKFMPYASFYIDQIDFSKNEIDIVYWNRDLKEEDLTKYPKSINFLEFKDEMEDSISKGNKIKHFLKYRNFIKQILKNNVYDLVISLHTLPGLLVLDKLILRYSNKYILDYRDSTFEANPIFGGLVKIMAKNAKLIFVSSDAFRKFLPSTGKEIITSHNILADSLKHREDRKIGYIPSQRIRVAFWGLLRHYKHNLLIIERLANNPRFELHYYGRELSMGKLIRQYIIDNNISNVFLHGEYMPEERYEFAKKTDIIHNNYNDANTLLAMGNKYYDGLIFRIPQLCMPGSYMAERCETKGVGFSIDPADQNFADLLYEAYKGINLNKFRDNCDKELNDILLEYEYGRKRIKELLNSQ